MINFSRNPLVKSTKEIVELMVEHANKLNWHIQTYLFIVVLLNRLAQREAEVDKAKKSNTTLQESFAL